jgi:hypothetical protein
MIVDLIIVDLLVYLSNQATIDDDQIERFSLDVGPRRRTREDG